MKKKMFSRATAAFLAALLLIPQTGVYAAEEAGEAEEVVLLDFTFDDEETGFKGGQAVAKPAGEIVTDGDRKVLHLDGTNTNWLEVTKEDGSSLLAGVEEMTISYDMKGASNWSFYAAPNGNDPVYLKEQYIGVMVGSKMKVERYKNNGERPAITGVPIDASDWVHVEITLGKTSTSVKINNEEPVVQEGLTSVLDILGRTPILYIGKAPWSPWGQSGVGEYYTGYLDNYKITGKVVELQADKTELQNALDAAASVGDDSKYTETSWKKFSDALSEAQKVKDNTSASQEEVDQATEALKKATASLSLADKNPAAKQVGTANPLVDYKFGADPFAMEYDGRIYVYMTNDSQEYEACNNGSVSNGYSHINTINVISSADMVNWTDHGSIAVAGRNNPEGAAKWASCSWAPAAAHKMIDGKEKFFLYFADGGGGIGVLEADSPIGPFVDPIGKALVPPGSPYSEGVIWLFDPAVFIDDDGTGYLYYGGGVGSDANNPKTSRVVKLSDDMVHLDGDAQVIDAPAIFEDSGIHKYGDKYYYSYCSNFSQHAQGYPGQGNICYMESDSPMGPFEYKGEILANPATFFGVGGNNHHAIFEFKGQYYITYHAQTLGKAIGNTNGYRSTHINKVNINSDGTINPITGDMKGVEQIESVNPYERQESETFAWNAGIKTAVCAEDGNMVKELNMEIINIQDGEWVAISDVDFGENGAKKLTANVAGEAGGTIEVRLDTKDGALAGTIEVPAGDGSYELLECALEEVSGKHDVYFIFKGEEGEDLMRADYWLFEENSEAVDKTELREVLAEVFDDSMAEFFTEDSWKAYQTVIENAKKVNDNAAATQEEVDAAVDSILEAEDALKFVLPFVDVPENAWFYDYVAYNFYTGSMTGKDDTHFAPEETLVRAQFATVLYKMNQMPDVEYSNKFPDVLSDDWFAGAVLWAADTGVVTGYTNTGKFGPNDNITREQMAVMMYRYAKNYLGLEVSADGDYSDFPDAQNVQEFAKDAMRWAVGNGIITGKTVNGQLVLDPQGNANRAECATIIERFMENIVEQ